MTTDNIEWLDHLKEALPSEGYGNKLSMYLISLEAWRRGIKVKFFTIDNPENKVLVRYSLEYNGRTHYFESSLGDKLSPEAFDVCEYKDLTKQYLSEAGIKVPEGKVFKTTTKASEIVEYVKTFTFPFVIKPLNENAGKGVFSNLNSEEELLDVIDYLRDELNYEYVIVEEHIPGDEYRILTVDGKVEGAVKRIPANIVGNGKDSINGLIRKKNRSKLKNPSISKKKIQLDKEVLQSIENNDFTLDSILKENEQLFLRTKSNISTGGDPVEVTDELSEEVKDAAEKATQAVPGLNLAGLDVIIDPGSGKPTVIEINTKPMIGLHVFPISGCPRDVVKSIVDMYFPETKEMERSNLHFDFGAIVDALDNVSVKKIDLEPLRDTSPTHSREVIIELGAKEGNFPGYIRLKALGLGVHGYVKKLETNIYQVVAGSPNPEVMDEFKNQFNNDAEHFEVSKVEEKAWGKSVNIGFITKKESVPELSEKLNKEKKKYKTLSDKLLATEHQLEDAERKIEEHQGRKNELLQEISKLEDEKTMLTVELGEIDRANQSTVNLLNKEVKNLRRERRRAEAERNKIWEKYKNTVNSKSWKLTKPLRKYNVIKKNKGN